MIIGIDEVNYSPSLTGDCVVCALFSRRPVAGVRDSKLTSHRERLELFDHLQRDSWYAVALAAVQDINQLGVYVARNFAMVSAVRQLQLKLAHVNVKPGEIVLDGVWSQEWLTFFQQKTRLRARAFVNADQLVYECAAASIVAKVYVDALFAGFDIFYPGYRLAMNHGSPDKVAYDKIRKDGATPYHRRGYGAGWWSKILEGKI